MSGSLGTLRGCNSDGRLEAEADRKNTIAKKERTVAPVFMVAAYVEIDQSLCIVLYIPVDKMLREAHHSHSAINVLT